MIGRNEMQKVFLYSLKRISYLLTNLFAIADSWISSGIVLHQHKFIHELLALYSMKDCTSVSLPLPSKFNGHLDEGELLQDPSQLSSSYKAWLVFHRSILSFILLLLYMYVLRYLKGTITQGLHFNKLISKKLTVTRRSVSLFFLFFLGEIQETNYCFIIICWSRVSLHELN